MNRSPTSSRHAGHLDETDNRTEQGIRGMSVKGRRSLHGISGPKLRGTIK